MMCEQLSNMLSTTDCVSTIFKVWNVCRGSTTREPQSLSNVSFWNDRVKMAIRSVLGTGKKIGFASTAFAMVDTNNLVDIYCWDAARKTGLPLSSFETVDSMIWQSVRIGQNDREFSIREKGMGTPSLIRRTKVLIFDLTPGPIVRQGRITTTLEEDELKRAWSSNSASYLLIGWQASKWMRNRGTFSVDFNGADEDKTLYSSVYRLACKAYSRSKIWIAEDLNLIFPTVYLTVYACSTVNDYINAA